MANLFDTQQHEATRHMSQQEAIEEIEKKLDSLPGAPEVVALSFASAEPVASRGGRVRVSQMLCGVRGFRLIGVEQITESPGPGVVLVPHFALVMVGIGNRILWPPEKLTAFEGVHIAAVCAPAIDGIALSHVEFYAIFENISGRTQGLKGRFLGQMVDLKSEK